MFRLRFNGAVGLELRREARISGAFRRLQSYDHRLSTVPGVLSVCPYTRWYTLEYTLEVHAGGTRWSTWWSISGTKVGDVACPKGHLSVKHRSTKPVDKPVDKPVGQPAGQTSGHW